MSKISPLGTSVYHIFNQPKTIIMLSNPSENPDHGKRIPSSSLNPTGGNAKLISIQPFPLLSTSISTVHPPTKVGCCGKRNPLNFSLYDEPLEKKNRVLVHISHFVHRRRRRQTSDVAFSLESAHPVDLNGPKKLKIVIPELTFPTAQGQRVRRTASSRVAMTCPPNHEQPRGWIGKDSRSGECWMFIFVLPN